MHFFDGFRTSHEINVPAIVQDTMDRFGELTGRAYRLVEHTGAADADRVVT